MCYFYKLNFIIKKAVKKTDKTFSERKPKIYNNLFHGAFDISPENLVIWYLFETDEELRIAESTGLCSEISETTIKNLISSGYPSAAFHSWKKVSVSFTTQEDIDKKSGGDIHLYFQ